jgi:hypothetical protein
MGFVLEEDAERLEQELAQACLERDSARNVLARAIEHERLANMRATEWEEARDAAQEVANRETLSAAYWKDKASAVSATPTMSQIAAEVVRARAKHPTWPADDTLFAACIVCEESGELMRAAVQHKGEGGSLEACDKEAIQTAAVAIRFLEKH